jgi:hypothetical protein
MCDPPDDIGSLAPFHLNPSLTALQIDKIVRLESRMRRQNKQMPVVLPVDQLKATFLRYRDRSAEPPH